MEPYSSPRVSSQSAKVVHLTSVHSANDNRIFHKQCRTLADASYNVVLVAPWDKDEIREGVRIKAVPRVRNRFVRMIVTTWRVFWLGLAEKGDLYHFHDPELIPIALLLRLMGKKVIYDVHEDYVTSISQKGYLPRFVRQALSRLFGWLETMVSRMFTVVLAERYYLRRFPKGNLILNYPHLNFFQSHNPIAPGKAANGPARTVHRFIYTGSVTIDRGALIYAKMVAELPDIEITVVGRCSPDLAAEMRRIAGSGASRLNIIGEGYFVPFSEIAAFYRSGAWTAGLAIFPRTPHYVEKELTKFFEYMAAGIPTLCSNFPIWRELIEGNGVGVCVDPDDMESIKRAITELSDNPNDIDEMGQRGRRAVLERFNWNVEGQKLLDLYKKLLG